MIEDAVIHMFDEMNRNAKFTLQEDGVMCSFRIHNDTEFAFDGISVSIEFLNENNEVVDNTSLLFENVTRGKTIVKRKLVPFDAKKLKYFLDDYFTMDEPDNEYKKYDQLQQMCAAGMISEEEYKDILLYLFGAAKIVVKEDVQSCDKGNESKERL